LARWSRLLQDDSINDILVNGPKQIFVERAGKLELTDVTFKDERHLLRIIDKIVSAVGGALTNPTPMWMPGWRTGRVSTRWCRPWRWTDRWSRSGNSRRKTGHF
jgi:Flp pilus assembly CpaF family ATPase